MMEQLTLDTLLDRPRLGRLLQAVRDLMLDRQWRTLGEIQRELNMGSEAGISARLRELDNRYGIQHEKRRRAPVSAGIWEYQINE
jgi:hypothetical protein